MVDENGIPKKDLTLQNPRCVLQLLKKHYSRYDLDTVSSVTGTPKDDLVKVYEAYSATGVPDKAGTIMYAMGFLPAHRWRPEHPSHGHGAAPPR